VPLLLKTIAVIVPEQGCFSVTLTQLCVLLIEYDTESTYGSARLGVVFCVTDTACPFDVAADAGRQTAQLTNRVNADSRDTSLLVLIVNNPLKNY
jgi:hypothetical protein